MIQVVKTPGRSIQLFHLSVSYVRFAVEMAECELAKADR